MSMAPARNFQQLVSLIKRAEERLKKNGGINDPEDRISALRGIYYGTEWSADFAKERSTIRNFGFRIFTGFSSPPDPRPALGSLFSDLQRSQDVKDGRHIIDTGHALIGMEARTNFTSRKLPIPSQGGTGLELVTWLGDLGGGAANLAFRRGASAKAAKRSVSAVFNNSGSDYGASINLEGDIAGYIIGTKVGDALQSPQFAPGSGVADAFSAYLPLSSASRARYFSRSKDFLRMLGGRFGVGGASSKLANRRALVTTLRKQIESFAESYFLQRYVVGQGRPSARVKRSCRHIPGAAAEVASVFVITLERHIASPRGVVAAKGPFPKPLRAVSSCRSTLIKAAVDGKDASKVIEKTVNDARRSAFRILRDLVD